ncbi:MAG: cytochrome c biogenesis protein ResB [Acidobacteriota bacterium]|nr:cytochrome c biogenesis protein ResB [Acidobacteriota bacterium]
MSAAEETIKVKDFAKPKTAPIVNRVLDFLSSVRFGVVLLCVLVAFSMLGMLVIQQNVQGFDAYYASLTPAEKLVYGSLGLFDVYYSWYFKLLLLVLSLNIVLASIDRFPVAWKNYISRPKVTATRDWILNQKQNAVFRINARNEKEVVEIISETLKHNGLTTQTAQTSQSSYAVDDEGKKDFSRIENKTYLYVFGQSGKYNRLGAYIVHVALLTLFLGHFVALQTGFDADVNMMPGQVSDQIQLIEFNLDQKEKFNVQLPFTITCTDIQQKLIDPTGEIGVSNTLDWRTQIKIDDPEYGETVADVSLNNPFSYRGYRFFQAQTVPVGNARMLKLELTPEKAGDVLTVDLMRNGAAAELPDGTKIKYETFMPDFVLSGGKPDTRSANYNNPAAVLGVTLPGGEKSKVYAFANKLPDNAPIGAPKAGFRWRLAEFEKAPLAHVLSIKYDPFQGALIAWYFGGFGLIGALIFVFFFSHKRVWALIDKRGENDYEIVLGGNANRNQLGFEDKFNKIVNDLEA